MVRRCSSVLACWLSLACGGSPPPAAAPESNPSEPSPAQSEPAPEAAAPEENAAESESAPAPAEAQPDTSPREVRYVQTPEGLKVEVSGVRFLVTVSSPKVGGGYGVRVAVKAESIDDKTHSLLSSDNGPIALAGRVTRKKQTTSFGDERKGEVEQTVGPGASLEFARDWPGKGGQPLGNNDSVELDVGLWGVGDSAETRRPVKAFARVKARVEGWKGRATVEPPPLSNK